MPVKTAQPSRLQTPSQDALLRAKAVVWPDLWAVLLSLKVDGKNFATNGREYMLPVMRDPSDEIIIKKAAQMGFTIGAILKALHSVVERHWHTLYLMPFKNGAITFVQGRIDPIMDSNPQLATKFNRVENRTHKQSSDKINLYVRGTNVLTELREIPVDFEVWDERDKFVENNLTEALARMDGSSIRRLMQLSTPTAPGHGVDHNENWHSTDQKLWFIPCSHCGRFQNLTMEDNVKIGDAAWDSKVECSHCHKELTDNDRRNANAKGRWEAQFLDGRKSGYHISQLNSPTKPFQDFIQTYFEGQSDSAKLRGFFNNQLGEPYAGMGDKFTEQILDDSIVRGHTLRTIPNGPVYVGVDIGAVLHVKASYFARGGKKMMYDLLLMKDFTELDKFLSGLNNFNCVIDAHPEKHKARELARKYPGKVWLGFERDAPNQTEVALYHPAKKRGEDVGTVVIDRTLAFDQLIADYQKGNYGLPINARELGEDSPRRSYNGFYAHHLEMVRLEEEDAKGRVVARWKKNRNPDHWHHADMFEMIAFMQKPRLRIPSEMANSIGGFYNNG